MERQLFDSNGGLNINASENSSNSDFDFFVGKWNVHNRKLKTRLNDCADWEEFEATDECYKVLNGFGNVNHFRATFDGVPFEGMTWRLFNPKTKLWSLYWADSRVVVLDVPPVGSFEGDLGKFYASDVFQEEEIAVQFQWDKTDSDNPVWSQAFSADGGKTWEWNWYMHFERRD